MGIQVGDESAAGRYRRPVDFMKLLRRVHRSELLDQTESTVIVFAGDDDGHFHGETRRCHVEQRRQNEGRLLFAPPQQMRLVPRDPIAGRRPQRKLADRQAVIDEDGPLEEVRRNVRQGRSGQFPGPGAVHDEEPRLLRRDGARRECHRHAPGDVGIDVVLVHEEHRRDVAAADRDVAPEHLAMLPHDGSARAEPDEEGRDRLRNWERAAGKDTVHQEDGWISRIVRARIAITTSPPSSICFRAVSWAGRCKPA